MKSAWKRATERAFQAEGIAETKTMRWGQAWHIWGTKKTSGWTSLVAQWLRICMPMQGTRVWALVRENPTCRGTTNPMRHNYWACALEPASHNYWAHVPQLLKPMHSRARAPQQREATAMRSPRTATKHSPRSPQLERARAQQQRPNTAKNK